MKISKTNYDLTDCLCSAFHFLFFFVLYIGSRAAQLYTHISEDEDQRGKKLCHNPYQL